MDEIKKTCLHEQHVALGAQMSPFGGFDMPIVYSDIAEEHKAVRSACGVFDVSHMGEVRVTGAEAEKFVNYIFTNDITGAEPGKIYYGMMLHPTGGVVDDLLVYKCGDHEFFLVINAANIDKDVAWIRQNAAKFDVVIAHESDQWGQLAIQGPDAEKVMAQTLGLDGSDLSFYTFKDVVVNGVKIIVSRTGYTGEDGFEVYAPAANIVEMWNKLIAAGVAPCGLGCRDTLRFEAGLPLYGDELSDDITPLEAGLGIFVKLDKPEFIGREALVEQKAQGLKRKLVGLDIDTAAPARHGYNVLDPDGNVIGQITTGYRSISLDKSIAMALIDANFGKLDTKVQVQIRRKVYPATVIKKRFYTPNYKK
jgi:aminomethyltransferase